MYSKRSATLDLSSTRIQKETKYKINSMKKETEYLFLILLVMACVVLSILSYSFLIRSEETLLIMEFFKRYIGLGTYFSS